MTGPADGALPVRRMIAAACVSYGGYEFARAASVSLFLTEVGAGWLPHALCAVAAVSFAMVTIYRRVVLGSGAAAALRRSCLALAVFFLLAAFVLGWAVPVDGPGRCVAVAAVFVVRQAYVTFISSQQFSFIVSLLKAAGTATAASANSPARSADTLGPLYGVTSLVSAAAAFLASRLTNPYVSMVCTSLTLVLSSLISDAAYASASAHPELMSLLKHEKDKEGHDEAIKGDKRADGDKLTSGGDSRNDGRLLPSIFYEHRSLIVLFVLTLLMQAVSSLIGISYASFLEAELTGQGERSAFVGTFYFMANGISALVQFFGLHALVSRLGLANLMVLQPCCLLSVVVAAYLFPGLKSAALAALVFKTIEYSLWSGTKDLTFTSLPFEARFVAKEFIDVFGYRSGKAGMAVMLAVAGYMTGTAFRPHVLIGVAGVLTGAWLAIAVKEQQLR